MVINKTDLAEAVGADLEVMVRDAMKMKQDGTTIFCKATKGKGLTEIVENILRVVEKNVGKNKLNKTQKTAPPQILN